jgi:hypothetical protein
MPVPAPSRVSLPRAEPLRGQTGGMGTSGA